MAIEDNDKDAAGVNLVGDDYVAIRDQTNDQEFEDVVSTESITLQVSQFFYRVYSNFFAFFVDEKKVKYKLQEANIHLPAELYFSAAIGYGAIGAFTLYALVGVLELALTQSLFTFRILTDLIISVPLAIASFIASIFIAIFSIIGLIGSILSPVLAPFGFLFSELGITSAGSDIYAALSDAWTEFETEFPLLLDAVEGQIVSTFSFIGDEVTFIALIFGALIAFVLSLALWLLIGTAISVASMVLAFTLARYYPEFVSRSREKNINRAMAPSISFMYSLAVGGTNQIKIIEQVAMSDDTYGEVSIEFRRILFYMRYYNMDYQTAIREVSDTTPSDEFSTFLNDLINVVTSGGDVQTFLSRKQDEYKEQSRLDQEVALDRLEVFGSMFTSLTILPLALILVLVVISVIGSDMTNILFIITYLGIPAINVSFIVVVSSIMPDEVGTGLIEGNDELLDKAESDVHVTDTDIVDMFVEYGNSSIFNRIKRYEIYNTLTHMITHPHKVWYNRPATVLLFSVPLALLLQTWLVVSGRAVLSLDAFVDDSFVQTLYWFYAPVIVAILPVVIVTELRSYFKGRITRQLSEDMEQLASMNRTGQPLLEAMKTTSQTSDSILAKEFETLYKKSTVGVDLTSSIAQMTNKYERPLLAQSMKLIQKAQEASSNISEVLTTTARQAKHEQKLKNERKKRSRQQIMIAGITFLVFAVLLSGLDVFLIGRLVEQAGGSSGEGLGQLGVGGSGGSSLDGDVVSTFFLHAVTLQGVTTGLLSGFIGSGDLLKSSKYVIGYMILSAVLWGGTQAIIG